MLRQSPIGSIRRRDRPETVKDGVDAPRASGERGPEIAVLDLEVAEYRLRGSGRTNDRVDEQRLERGITRAEQRRVGNELLDHDLVPQRGREREGKVVGAVAGDPVGPATALTSTAQSAGQ